MLSIDKLSMKSQVITEDGNDYKSYTIKLNNNNSTNMLSIDKNIDS